MADLMQAAKGKWTHILSQYIPSEFLTGKHTSCPVCGGKDRFRYDDKFGNGDYYCTHCGFGTGWKLLADHQGITLSDAAKLVERILPSAVAAPRAEQKKGRDLPGKLWRESVAVEDGDDVSRYLQSRGITHVPKSLRKVFYKGYCCMIAKAVKGNKAVGVHLTSIDSGKKANIDTPKRTMGVGDGEMKGSVIRLMQPEDTLIIAEGIETALSAAKLWGFPCWSSMNAPWLELAHAEIPASVITVIIAADNDKSFTGQAAAYALAKKLAEQGRNVEVRIPDRGDWNDVLVGE